MFTHFFVFLTAVTSGFIYNITRIMQQAQGNFGYLMYSIFKGFCQNITTFELYTK